MLGDHFRKRKILFVLFLFFFSYATAELDPPKKKICLNMIVKNESRIIKRCLNSVAGIVDYISISDTGSTDDTVAIIESFMKEKGIKGKVHHHEWKNFGHNRSESFLAAQDMLKGMGASLSDVYLLLLDADMILNIDPAFDAQKLDDDVYMIKQKSSSFAYYNVRLIKASLPWKCVGVTHEYWSCDLVHSRNTLNTLVIDDQEDGGSKNDKFTRDVKLLTEGLQEDPNNERYMFYAAVANKGLRNFPEAIRLYKARIDKGGWAEEVWYSKYMIGECYADMGYWDQALHWYLDAYQYRPTRAEPLKNIATYYRLKGINNLAYLFAKQGSQIPYPKEDTLFVAHPAYNYEFDEEISITAFYTPYKQEGLAAINRLLLKRDVPSNVKEQSIRNLLFYVENLKSATFLPINIELPPISESSAERYYLMNPTIQRVDDGYRLICRTVNFSSRGGIEYKSRDPLDDTIRTKNYLCHFGQDLKLVSQKEIIEDLPRDRLNTRVQGLEDCRLAILNNENWFLASTYDVPPGTIVQVLCKLSSQSNDSSVKVESLVALAGNKPNRTEKNWLPFAKDDKLYAVYLSDPFLIYQINTSTGACEKAVEYEPKSDFSRFRGSAAPIKFDDGYLMLIHEVIFQDQRYYTHRFVYMNKDFVIEKVSKPFTFLHKGIEYCCGMTLSHTGKNCILTVGIEDKAGFFCIVDVNSVRSSLDAI